MNRVSFMLANYCARPLGYNMTGGWAQGAQATVDYFQPDATFAGRFDEYLLDARALGFDAIDMWTDILGPRSATQQKVETAQELLRKHSLDVCSYGGWFGSSPDEFRAMCELAAVFGSPVLGGNTSMLLKDRDFVVGTLKEYGLRLGIENHPESVEEMFERIGDGADGAIGATVDTGWYGTQGVDAAQAIERLASHLFLVHLKDVREVGAHNTCRYGDGVVPIERCVRTLQAIGYGGSISVEHEPEHYDPSGEVGANLLLLKGWLGERP